MGGCLAVFYHSKWNKRETARHLDISTEKIYPAGTEKLIVRGGGVIFSRGGSLVPRS